MYPKYVNGDDKNPFRHLSDVADLIEDNESVSPQSEDNGDKKRKRIRSARSAPVQISSKLTNLTIAYHECSV